MTEFRQPKLSLEVSPRAFGGLAPLIGRAAMGNEVSSAEDPHEPATRAGAAQLPISLNTRAPASNFSSRNTLSRAGTVPVGLRWPHGGKTAYVCGSFTQWQKVPMQWRQSNSGGEWFKVSSPPSAPAQRSGSDACTSLPRGCRNKS